jgi:hypothetical protein
MNIAGVSFLQRNIGSFPAPVPINRPPCPILPPAPRRPA